MDNTCAYCMEGELVAEFGIKICELPASKVYLFKEQSHPGRLIVVSEMVDLSEADRIAFLQDVNHMAEVIHKTFSPAKVNYGAYGDKGCHLHFHLVPKYTGAFEWGGTFAMNPDKNYLSEKEYEEMISKIKANL